MDDKPGKTPPIPYTVRARQTEPWELEQRTWFVVACWGAGIFSYEHSWQAEDVAAKLNQWYDAEVE